MWSTYNGRLIKTLLHHSDVITDIAIDNSNLYVAVGSKDKTVSLWEIKRLELIAIFDNHADEISKLEFANIQGISEPVLISASPDGIINIYEIYKIMKITKKGDNYNYKPTLQLGKEDRRKCDMGKIIRISIHPHIPIIAVGNTTGIVYIWEFIVHHSVLKAEFKNFFQAHKKDCLLLEWSLSS